ncbi:protein of unknown function [Candidatus Promineifilum breve]|uniref:Uncharacterized protein n=1 Tax=Candidatus Promineifilum breve TaxID=1806508 RepID=A0A160T4J5_9CHLR|nr:hypothetical protein [Candidatus Promineifilum breve]CUS04712.2 protein of unknown function [Candidatus Promineifilum breve]
MNEKPTPTTPEIPPAGTTPHNLPPGIKVYERPQRRTMPLWLSLGLLLVLAVLVWFAYQAFF